jgi:hypothetical protein
MRVFLMLAQALAMVTHSDHQRVPIPAMPLKAVEKTRQGRVGVCDFAVVKTILVSLGIGEWRLVGIVRIIWTR